ncbi:MAG TPA: hypothetical protein VJV75_10605 [Candidatus Polarisedimenticolia bacterium]|nr:hypothetical protein [Candidatus Polarisedimenticolia bacterium]
MRIVLIGIVVLVVAVTALAFYMGCFRRVTISEETRGPFTLVYRDMAAGDMKKVGEITSALDTLLSGAGVAKRKPLDVFLPDGTGEIGFAVEGVPAETLARLGGEAKVKEIAAQRCMVAEFPWRNPMSFMVGYFKVDPALTGHRTAHGYRKVEALALNDGDRIIYMQPVVPL